MVNYRFEPLSFLLLNGLPELAYEAWLDTKFHREHPEVPYSPDWQAYQNQEEASQLRLIAMREHEKLIGYVAVILDTDIHRKGVMMGMFRDIFITKSKRGYAAQFVNFIEKQLSSIGVHRIYGGERLDEDGNGTQVGKFYKIMQFSPQELIWGKTIQATVH